MFLILFISDIESDYLSVDQTFIIPKELANILEEYSREMEMVLYQPTSAIIPLSYDNDINVVDEIQVDDTDKLVDEEISIKSRNQLFTFEKIIEDLSDHIKELSPLL
ncbi:hypothetical protein L2E82_50528 [Cichorium intybus]|nr:hypothetical protein L2E82_50528 [Cichorium intybus]